MCPLSSAKEERIDALAFKTKVVVYDVDLTQGAAAFALSMRLEGYRVLSVVRKGTKATVTYERIEKE